MKTSHLLAGMLLSAGIALCARADTPGPQTAAVAVAARVTDGENQIRLSRVTPGYWRVTLHNPPFNIFGPGTISQLRTVVAAIEGDPQVKVVVFESDVPGFFMTHFDFVPPLEETTGLPPGKTGLPQLPDILVRLSKAPVVSIAMIRGRATGVGSELALACDMRFASRENALLSQFEIGAGFVPGGGPSARLPRLIGRGRALEVLTTGTYLNADIAERYGYVNRSLPDVELDAFVDTMARRIAGFSKQTLADIKRLVDASSLPPDDQFGVEWQTFLDSVRRPAAQSRIGELMKQGLQRDAELEQHLDQRTGKLPPSN